MGFKVTSSSMESPSIRGEFGRTSSGPILKAAPKIPQTPANHRSKVSDLALALYEGPSIDINQRDIDRAAKKYHREMKNRLKEFRTGKEEIEMEPGFVPVQRQPANHQVETCPDVRSRPRLSSRLKSLKHQRPRRQSQERVLRKPHREIVLPANDSILGSGRHNRQISVRDNTYDSESSEWKGLRRQIRISEPQRSQVDPREEQSSRKESYEPLKGHNNREHSNPHVYRRLAIGSLNEILRMHEPTRQQIDPQLSSECGIKQSENIEELIPKRLSDGISLKETLQNRSVRLAETYSGFRYREGSQPQENSTLSTMSEGTSSDDAGQSKRRENNRVQIEPSLMQSETMPRLNDYQRRLRDRDPQMKPRRISQTDPDLRSHNREYRMHSTRTSLAENSVQSDSNHQLPSTERHRSKYLIREQNKDLNILSEVNSEGASSSRRRIEQQPNLNETILDEANPELHSVEAHNRIVDQRNVPDSNIKIKETYAGFRYREGRQSQQSNLASSHLNSNEGGLVRHLISQNSIGEPLQNRSEISHEETSIQLPLPLSSTSAGMQSQNIHNNRHRQGSPRISLPYDRAPVWREESNESPQTPEDQPPSDEYYVGNEAEIPPYHATLHKYLDLISYDPRVVPCLRVNRSLIKNNDKLSESIFQFLKFNLFPESIDPWEISHIDDQHYDDLIPDLIPVETDSDVLPNLPSEPHYRYHDNIVPHMVSDDDYEYALYLSTLENNVHNYSPRFRSPL